MRSVAWFCAVLSVCSGCVQMDTAPASLIDGARIIAVEAEPPEAMPGGSVQYRAWAVDGAGDLADADFAFGYCRDAKPIGDNRIAADGCVDGQVDALPGTGSMRVAAVPNNACNTFGPLVGADRRPQDADASGGYYQPLRVETSGVIAIGLERITCPLPNLPLAAATELRERAQLNQNPEFDTFAILQDGTELAPDSLPADRELTLRVRIAATSSESYVFYDASSASIDVRRERLSVGWFISDGSLQSTQSTLPEGHFEVQNIWHVPSGAKTTHLWLVLRDDRGGLRVLEQLLSSE